MLIREATSADAAACSEIYGDYVRDTAITFELDPPTVAEMAERIERASRRHCWLVAADGDDVLGYAYGGEFRSRPAYRFCCETSVYVAPGCHRSGTGRALYETLLTRLTERGYRTAVAAMTLPNDASVGLHRALGFEPAGTLRAVGWKLGRWHDVATVQRGLADGDDPPAEPS